VALATPPSAQAQSDDDAMILEVVRDLVRERVAPRAAEIDERGEFARDIYQLFADNDLLGIPFPAEYGGLGLSFLTYVKVVEEVSKACASSGLMIAVQELGALALAIAGSDAQKHKYLTPLSTGAKIGCYALSEAGSGSDAAGSMRCRAEKRGDTYVLSGSKVWITNGPVADLITVFAVTDPEKGPAGISAFIVEKEFPGFKVGKLEKKMGIRGSPTCELIFENCVVPAENMLGAEGTGFKTAMRVLDKSRPGIAAQAVGIAAGALEYATNYAMERMAFGKPIAHQQGIQFMLADMRVDLESARLLLYEAARKCDANAPDMTTWAALAKLKAGDAAMSITTDAVQILGGFGYSTEYPVERMMRDAKITQIYEGTQQIQRMVIARSMISPRR